MFLQRKLRFLICFSIANMLLFWLIGLRYLFTIFSSKSLFATSIFAYTTVLGKIFVMLFLICTYLGHFALLAFLPCLALFPLAFISRKILIFISICVWSICIIGLIADNIVFNYFHFHLNLILLKTIFNPQYGLVNFIELSSFEIIASLAIIVFIFLIETLLAFLIWKKIILANKLIYEKKVIGSLASCLCLSYIVFIITIANNNNVLAQQTPNLPLYNNILSYFLPVKNSLSLVNRYSETRFAQPLFPIAPLSYPLQALRCKPLDEPYNILMIVIDSWRFDALNQYLTPHINQFSKKAINFKNHYSGGNSTQAGLFSLFYGLPSNYWSSMLEQRRGAVLFDELLKQQYQTKILFSSNMIPPFHQTIFAELKNLRTTQASGKTIPDHDRTITKEFADFIKTRDKTKPFFSFLFYDAAHSYYSEQNIPKIYPTHDGSGQRFLAIQNNADAIEVMNRYKNALHFIDEEIQTVLDVLNDKKLLDQTIIIITSDHGEEFDDNHLKFWGHGSNYTRYQIQTPFILYKPDLPPKDINHLTSHYDVTPFLLSTVLGCENKLSDYSIAESLLHKHQKKYLLVGSYLNMSIVERTKHTTLLTTGNIQITDNNGNELLDKNPNPQILTHALQDMRRFYRRNS